MVSKIIKNLNGHSGCKIDLATDGNDIYVTKMSASKEYNFRLKKQYQKQRKFVNSQRVLAPRIYNCGYHNELFYFNMEYLKSKTLAEYMQDISIIEIADYIKCLFDFLYWKEGRICNNTSQIFLKKIENLRILLPQDNNINDAFNLLESFNWNQVPKSPCHGDLTLENILITQDKKLYLIDFLDSFYNSWMMDIAKLLQDLELRWSFRYKVIDSNTELRLLVAKEALIEEILKIENGSEKLNIIYHILLLNIIRIYPYAKDCVTINFLNIAINLIVNKLNKNKGVVV